MTVLPIFDPTDFSDSTGSHHASNSGDPSLTTTCAPIVPPYSFLTMNSPRAAVEVPHKDSLNPASRFSIEAMVRVDSAGGYLITKSDGINSSTELLPVRSGGSATISTAWCESLMSTNSSYAFESRSSAWS